ncbi:SOS mutagenesis protein UmuD [Leptospira fluminis]|uniref:SOS mutagenesis protein UmuD n=1 Tax=Leptospira fluminis TaxID=2484979 RepID=A0A4R9GPL8_9LEPT|nr:SOS mutagenesis protein UmuD [Leptospira fluminis]TGK18978.1 SOS mutagenesis protein UmuD [Leptospira fluminis]
MKSLVYLERISLIPVFKNALHAGTPTKSPDPSRMRDILSFLDHGKASKIFVTVKGDAWKNFGILDKDRLVIDRLREMVDASVVLVYSRGNYLFRKVSVTGLGTFLFGPDKGSTPIPVDLLEERILGVVTGIVHRIS